ncbi:MAG: MerR family transcriptional regulator, partial [Firmicutes bacterium]|nr:MerR family transcriptional regulator [Bacillota bacterium]
MEYSINELSKLAGVSARTLRYYDEIGLLKPAYINDAGYRFYTSDEVDVLQQILFYRERGLELKTIERIIHEKDFDMLGAMENHLLELENQRARTEALIETVKKTIEHMKGEREMTDMEKFQAFREEAAEKYGEDEVNASYMKISGLSA